MTVAVKLKLKLNPRAPELVAKTTNMGRKCTIYHSAASNSVCTNCI